MVELRDDRWFYCLAAALVLVRSKQLGPNAVHRERSVDPYARRELPRWYRRYFAPARIADDTAWTARRFVVMVDDRESRKGILRLHADAAGRHARRVRVTRFLPLLRVLGSDARADVFPDRRVGRPEEV